jgi:hypothetical protein
MGLHGIKGGRRDILKAQMHLDIFMKQFHLPDIMPPKLEAFTT